MPPPAVEIYRDDIVFRDRRNTFSGIKNYKTIFWSLRFHGRIFFSKLYVEVKRIWQPSDNTICMRWTVHGIPRVRARAVLLRCLSLARRPVLSPRNACSCLRPRALSRVATLARYTIGLHRFVGLRRRCQQVRQPFLTRLRSPAPPPPPRRSPGRRRVPLTASASTSWTAAARCTSTAWTT